MHSAIAENRIFLPQVNLRDLDALQKLRLLRPVEQSSQRGQDRIIGMGVRAELRDRLRDEDVEPVQGLGLVRMRVVVRLRQDRGRGGRGGFVAEGRHSLVVTGSGAGGRDREGGRGRVAGRRVAEDEEFDEGTDEDHDRELAEEEALREGQPAFVSVLEAL